jgi:hypothetical protein
MTDAHLPDVRVRRAVVTWAVAAPLVIVSAWLWRRVDDIPEETPLIVLVAVLAGFSVTWAVVLGMKTTNSVRNGHVVSGGFSWLIFALFVFVWIRGTAFWPRLAGGVALATAVHALVIALAVAPNGGYRPLRPFGAWSGLWAPVDPEVARLTPISWKHAVRAWLIVFPIVHGVAVALLIASHALRLNLLVAPMIAYVITSAGLAGTMNRQRCRHWEWTMAVDFVVWGLSLLTCGFGFFAGTWLGPLIWIVLVGTAGLAASVILTNRPLRTSPVPPEPPAVGV